MNSPPINNLRSNDTVIATAPAASPAIKDNVME
jgi:hypothetical protein